MAKIIVVTSGKGGVGKTTTSASFAAGLAMRGHKTAVIDFDVGCATWTSSWGASAAWCTT
jgi:septum site-determining protein MinD